MSFVDHIMAHLFFLCGICMLPHGPQRALEQVVHTFDGAPLQLWEAEVDEHNAGVCQHRVEQEHSPTHARDHVWRGAGDAVVDDPVDEETE